MELFLQEPVKLGSRFYLAFAAADRWKLHSSGLGNTPTIALDAIYIGMVLRMLLRLMKIFRYRILHGLAKAYIGVIYGTPVVVQLMFICFVALVTWANRTSVGIVAFGFNFVTCTTEIFRSGVLTADKGQTGVGRSPSLTHGQTMRSIISPQDIKNCLPTYTSEFIVLVEETVMMGYIGMTDLAKVYSTIQSHIMGAMPSLIIIAVVYFCIAEVLSVTFAKMERRLRENDRR